MQLGLFEHSRDVMLRNDLVVALQAQDAAGSRKALDALAEEMPHDPILADAQVLVSALERAAAQPGPPPFAAPSEAAAAAEIAAGLMPAAERSLPRGSAQFWLAPHWASLARRAARLPYDAETPQGHAAALWLQARDWAAAAEHVAGIESWRRIPQPLAWMAEARHHGHGLDAPWPLWVELAWLAPQRFAEVAARVADGPLTRLMQRFEGDFDTEGDAGDWAWFPAWCLVDSPTLAAAMDDATASTPSEPARAWSLLQSLLRLERRGQHHEVVKSRALLRACHAGLFELYMRSR